MKIYRKMIPSISKETLRSLLNNKLVDIVDGHREDAELDISGVFIRYLNEEERLKSDARDFLKHHNLPETKLGIVKKNLAESRGFVSGDGSDEWLLEQLINALFDSNHIAEVYAEDNELRLVCNSVLNRYKGVDEQLDKEVRGRIRQFREGTTDWDVEYDRIITEMRHIKRFE